jgi:hypothetical protein
MTTDTLIVAFVEELRARGVAVSARDNASMLERLELELAVRLPDSYRSLVSRFDYSSIDVGGITLYGTTPSDDYEAVHDAAVNDRALYDVVRTAGFVPIGRPETGSYDPVCFDTRRAVAHHEYPIVRLDHEQALCHSGVKITGSLAGSFRELVTRYLDGG